MTVSTTYGRVTLNGNGATRSFPYSFEIPTDSDARVIVTDDEDTATVLNPSQFLIFGVGSDNGGTVTYPASELADALPTGWTLTIARAIPLTQPLDLQNQGAYNAEVIETAFDRVTMQLQQVAETAGSGGAGAIGSSGPINWGDVVDKPVTYPPDSHTHALATASTAGFMSAAEKLKLAALSAASVTSVNGATGAVAITTGSIGALPTSQKAAANGLASLGADGKVPAEQLPAGYEPEIFVVASEAAMLALSASVGDFCIRTDEEITYILQDTPASTLGNWVELPGGAAGAFSQATVYAADATDSVTRSLVQRAADTLTLYDFGAVGDGVADDTDAWNAYVAHVNSGATRRFNLGSGKFLIEGDIDPFTVGFSMAGEGHGASTVIAGGAGTSPLISLDTSALAVEGMVSISGIGFRSVQDYVRDCIDLAWDTVAVASQMRAQLHSLDIQKQFHGGIHVHNCIELTATAVNINGGPANSELMVFGWKFTSDAGKYCVGVNFVGCVVTSCLYGIWATGHIEGFDATGFVAAFVGWGAYFDISDTNNSPEIRFRGGQMEVSRGGHYIKNAAYVGIGAGSIYLSAVAVAGVNAIYLEDVLNANVHDMTAISGAGSTDWDFCHVHATYPLATPDVAHGAQILVHDNNVGFLTGAGVRVTGHAAYVKARNNNYHDVMSSGAVPFWCTSTGLGNEHSGTTTNSSFSAMVGSSSGGATSGGALALATAPSFVIAASVAVPVQAGERLHIQAVVSINSPSANTAILARIREYNHRPAAPSPYTVFTHGGGLTSLNDIKNVFSGKATRFFFDAEVTVVGSATDALFVLELQTDGATALADVYTLSVRRI